MISIPWRPKGRSPHLGVIHLSLSLSVQEQFHPVPSKPQFSRDDKYWKVEHDSQFTQGTIVQRLDSGEFV